MSRHANLKNIINDAEDGDYGYYDEAGTDLYNNYGDEYGDEDYYDQTYVQKSKKSKKGMPMDYEDDLEGDPDLAKAIEESKQAKPKKAKKQKSKVEEPEEGVVVSLGDHFEGYFSHVQIRDTLIANKNDVDKTI